MTSLTADQKSQFGKILGEIAKSIDLTPTQYEEAQSKYNAVAAFLCKEGHDLARYSPKISCQGSMRTGTPVRPVIEEDEFDVDLTCHLDVALPEAQSTLKDMVGDRFKGDGTYKEMLEEKRRCWRLHYHESSKFHLDIVPAILLQPYKLLSEGVSYELAKHLIAITDNETENYRQKTSNWLQSNPEGYALWFLDATVMDAETIRKSLVESRVYAHISQIPDYEVRTPLQQSVQLMKRHRDIMFNGDEDKPVSVIITTLAAKAYSQTVRAKFPYGSSASFYDLLLATIDAMPTYIERRNDVAWIANPVNPTENFADKWAEKKTKEANFYKWHTAFRSLVADPNFRDGLIGMADKLKLDFGSRAVSEAFQKMGANTNQSRSFDLPKTVGAGGILTAAPKVKAHTFHGKI